MTALVVTIVCVWLCQRLLATRQAMRFRRQYEALRQHGHVAVGTSKRFGRRVYVALAADAHGVVTDNIVYRGVTVFANGRNDSRLNSHALDDIISRRIDSVVPSMVVDAARQAALFLKGRGAESFVRNRRKLRI